MSTAPAAAATPTRFDAEMIARIVGLPLRDADKVMAGLPTLAATPVSPARRAEIVREIEDTITQRRFRVIGEGDDQAVWQKGWSEVAAQIRAAETITLETMKPQYFHRGVPLRLLGDYWATDTDYFEYYLGIAVRRLLMLHAFEAPKRIVELGCGTGMNILLAAELFPNAQLVGTDWVQASVDILADMAGKLRRDVRGAIYNMLSGEGGDALPIDGDTDVITVHALEQLGAAAPNVIELLMRKRPRTVLHIEPIVDFYDRANPYDDIAARYHLVRGYLQGLAPTLEELAARDEIEILSKGRVQLGNLYHEAYSHISWRPKP